MSIVIPLDARDRSALQLRHQMQAIDQYHCELRYQGKENRMSQPDPAEPVDIPFVAPYECSLASVSVLAQGRQIPVEPAKVLLRAALLFALQIGGDEFGEWQIGLDRWSTRTQQDVFRGWVLTPNGLLRATRVLVLEEFEWNTYLFRALEWIEDRIGSEEFQKRSFSPRVSSADEGES